MKSIYLKNVNLYLDKAAKEFGIDKKVSKILKSPDRVLSAKIKIKMNGKQVLLPAWRAQNNNSRGPYKGGIRFHHEVNKEEVEALALSMTLKTALYNLPFGGAKGGVKVYARKMPPKKREEISRKYIRAFHKGIGPYVDIPAPDLNTNSQVMAWMMDEYSIIKGYNEPGVVTGKPKLLGGSELRSEATAYGGYFVLKEFLKYIQWKKKPQNTTVAIQGFGNVGRNIAKILFEDGFKIVALSDFSGAVQSGRSRLNPFEIEEGISKGGLVSGCYLPGIRGKQCGLPITRDDLLSLGVDILIPAAAENQIRKDNYKNIKSKIILELANGPTTPEAERELLNKGVYVIPDVLANGGGVVVSYFEWVQDLERFFWTRDEVLKRLKEISSKVFKKVGIEAKDKKTSLRSAAYGLALKNLESVFKLRGRI